MGKDIDPRRDSRVFSANQTRSPMANPCPRPPIHQLQQQQHAAPNNRAGLAETSPAVRRAAVWAEEGRRGPLVDPVHLPLVSVSEEPPPAYGEGEPELTTGEGEPELTTGEGEPELTTEKIEPELTTGEGEPELTTEKIEPELTTGEGELAEQEESPPAYEEPPAYDEGGSQLANGEAESPPEYSPMESLLAKDAVESPPASEEVERELVEEKAVQEPNTPQLDPQNIPRAQFKDPIPTGTINSALKRAAPLDSTPAGRIRPAPGDPPANLALADENNPIPVPAAPPPSPVLSPEETGEQPPMPAAEGLALDTDLHVVVELEALLGIKAEGSPTEILSMADHERAIQEFDIFAASLEAPTISARPPYSEGSSEDRNLLDEVLPILKTTPLGSGIADALKTNDIVVISGKAGRGTYYQAKQKIMVIDPLTPFPIDVAVAHLSLRAATHFSDEKYLNPTTYDLGEEYIDVEIDELASAISYQMFYNMERNKTTGSRTHTTLEYLSKQARGDDMEEKRANIKDLVLGALERKDVIAASIGLSYQDVFRMRWDRAQGNTPAAPVLKPPAPQAYPGFGVAAVVGVSTIGPLEDAYVDPAPLPPISEPPFESLEDPMPYLVPFLDKTRQGQDALLIKEVFKTEVILNETYQSGDDMGGFLGEVNIIDTLNVSRAEMAQTLTHEFRHGAWYHLEIRGQDHVTPFMTEEQYVAWEIIEEADTFATEIEDEIEYRDEQWQTLHYRRDTYRTGYQRGANAEFALLKAKNAYPDPELLDKAGKAGARKELQAYIRDKSSYPQDFLSFFRDRRDELLGQNKTDLSDTLIAALEKHPRLREIRNELQDMVEDSLSTLADSIDIAAIEAKMDSSSDESDGEEEFRRAW